MTPAKLIHNEKAGTGSGRYDKDELLSMLAAEGYDCRYSSTKDRWQHLDPEVELVIAAGGDGTVRKVAGWMGDKPAEERKPIAILPLGTANNIAKTLHINGHIQTLIGSWAEGHRKKFDIGRLKGGPPDSFFIEGCGFGIFPRLMKEMSHLDKSGAESPEQHMETAFRMLHRILSSFQPIPSGVELNGQLYEGRFMLVEVLNIPYIGPNLCLAPPADPGDGHLDVVMVSENDRHQLADFILHKMSGTTTSHGLNVLQAQHLTLHRHGHMLHVDDEIIDADPFSPISIGMERQALEFLVASSNV